MNRTRDSSRFTPFRGKAPPFISISGAAPPRDATVQHTEAPPRGNETILVVEDEEIVRELDHRFRDSGITVCWWRKTEAAWRLRTAPEPIALVLTDVVMPKMKGCDGRALMDRTS
jgi:response regulator RpfG family c-di-GMP phosphodiesterase